MRKSTKGSIYRRDFFGRRRRVTPGQQALEKLTAAAVTKVAEKVSEVANRPLTAEEFASMYLPKSVSAEALRSQFGDINFREVLAKAKLKTPSTTVLMAIFSFDRWYLKQALLSILKIVTIGGLVLWWFVDLITATSRTRKHNATLLGIELNKTGPSA